MERLITKLLSFINSLYDVNSIELVEEKMCTEVMDLPQEYLERRAKFLYEHKKITVKECFYGFFNISKLKSCWCYTNENNEFIYGGFWFNGLSEALAQRSKFWDVFNSLNRHHPSEEELEFLKKLNWFEKQAWAGGDGKFGCFLREPGDFPPKIYFYDSGAYFPMNISLEEYFDAMIASCAVRGWQYFYIDFPDKFPELREVNREKVLAELTRTVTVLPRLFPDRDFSYHQERYREIERKLKNQ
jgi:hypothetical protein